MEKQCVERVEAHLAAITILKLQEKCCHEKSKKLLRKVSPQNALLKAHVPLEY